MAIPLDEVAEALIELVKEQLDGGDRLAFAVEAIVTSDYLDDASLAAQSNVGSLILGFTNVTTALVRRTAELESVSPSIVLDRLSTGMLS